MLIPAQCCARRCHLGQYSPGYRELTLFWCIFEKSGSKTQERLNAISNETTVTGGEPIYRRVDICFDTGIKRLGSIFHLYKVRLGL